MDVPEKSILPLIAFIQVCLVIVFFRPVGSAPLLKQTKFKISSSLKFQAISDFLRRQLCPSNTSGNTNISNNGSTSIPTSPQSSPQLYNTSPPGREEELVSLFLYINSSFAPAADEIISNLYACFAVDNVLIVNYSMTPAWG